MNTYQQELPIKDSPAFVGFYESNHISPVSQDISDIHKHFQRRDSLFRALGILPNLVKKAAVLEFGPGSGHNSLYTASLSPSSYELVEGNSIGYKETTERLASFASITKIHHTLFTEYKSSEEFDIVWAEGCLPHQSDPIPLMQHMASFVALGGCICVSTNNGISYLSEILRRLFRDRFFEEKKDIHDMVTDLQPYIQPHLQHLRGMSRPVEDWILDSIIQPMKDRQLLSIPEVINSLSQEFDIYGSSPRFLTDWRWYKEIIGENRKFNEMALDNYYKNNLNLLDYRFNFPGHSREYGEKLESMCSRTWDLMCDIEKGTDSAWGDIFHLIDEICFHVQNEAPETVRAIREACILLQSGSRNMELNYFPMWWGRGQNYLSLIKRKG